MMLQEENVLQENVNVTHHEHEHQEGTFVKYIIRVKSENLSFMEMVRCKDGISNLMVLNYGMMVFFLSLVKVIKVSM